MTDRGAKALTDEDAKLFIGNLSYHVSNYNLMGSKELNQDVTSSLTSTMQTREERLMETFGKYGSIKECRVARESLCPAVYYHL